jgi:hypothetical protein
MGKPSNDETQQNFIYKHTVDLANVQKNKKKNNGEVTGCQVSLSSKLKLDVKISSNGNTSSSLYCDNKENSF